MHRSLSLSSSLTVNALSQPLFLFFFFFHLVTLLFPHLSFPILPLLLLPSLSPSPRPLFSPAHLAPPLPAAHGVDRQCLSLISFAPPSGFLTHSIHIGAEGRQKASWWNPPPCVNTPLLSWQSANICAHESLNYYVRVNVHASAFECVSVSTRACVSICVFLLLINHLDIMWELELDCSRSRDHSFHRRFINPHTAEWVRQQTLL